MVIHGADTLAANLRALPRSLATATLRRALLKAAEPMRAEAARLLPSDAPWRGEYIVAGYRLTKRQAANARKSSRTEVFVYVGVKPKRHLHLIEFGTGPRYTRSGGFRGRMPPNPYMRPAFDSTAELVLEDFGEMLGREIIKTAERLAKRQQKRLAAIKG